MTTQQQTPRVFLSYARDDDEPFVKRLFGDLTTNGIDVWWDRVAMESRGRTFLQELRDAIEGCDRLIAVVGPKAVASEYVRAEWAHAALFCKGVTPILCSGEYSQVPSWIYPDEAQGLADVGLSRLHCLDFRGSRRYDEALAELLRIVRKPVAPLVPFLTTVPALPPHFLPRRDELEQLAALMLEDMKRPMAITSAKQVTGLQGMGGIGKSVLAAAFARSAQARRAFTDGIVWITCGQEPNLVELFALLGAAFDDDATHYTDRARAQARLPRLLEDKVALIVLDDVWHVPVAEPFLNALGPRCRLLITTRNQELVIGIGARPLLLDVLGEEEAFGLLADWADVELAALPPEAPAVVQECGHLPLAIAMIGAMVRGNPSRWAYALYKLRIADLKRIKRDLPNYPYPDLLRAIAVSVEELEPQDRQRYCELAVFPENVPISAAAIAALWQSKGDGLCNAQDVMALFVERSLARHDTVNRLTLHDLQRDYIRTQVENLVPLHERLVDSYQQSCTDGWASGPQHDQYFWRYLAYHLKEAGRSQELFELARDKEFLQCQEVAFPDEPGVPLQTLRLAIRAAAEHEDPVRVTEFVLAHTHRVTAGVDASPLRALRSGQLLRAWELADLDILESSVLWHLLLARELHETGKGPDAVATLGRLDVSCKPELRDWAGEFVIELAAPLIRAGFTRALDIVAAVLDPKDMASLAARLRKDGGANCVREIAMRIEDPHYRADALIEAGLALAQHGDRTGSEEVFHEAGLAAREPPHWPEDLGLRLARLGEALLQAGMFQAGLEATRDVHWGYGDEAFREKLAVAQAMNGRFEDARATARSYYPEYRRGMALGRAALAMSEAGFPSEARETVHGIDDPESLARSLANLALAEARAGRVDDALELARTIESDRHRASALAGVARTAAPDRLQEEVSRVCDEVLRLIEEQSPESESCIVLRDVAAALAEVGLFDASVRAARIHAADVDLARTKCEIATIRARAGDVQGARQMFDEVGTIIDRLDESEKWSMRVEWGLAMARGGLHADARRVADEIESSPAQVDYFRDTARIHAADGSGAEERAAYADAVSRIRPGDYEGAGRYGRADADYDVAESLFDVSTALVESGRFDAAERVAESTGCVHERNQALAIVAIGHAKEGNDDEARRVAALLEKDPRALAHIAAAQADAGRIEEAVRMSERVGALNEQARAQSAVAVAQARAGDLETALQTALGIEHERLTQERVFADLIAFAEPGELLDRIVEASRAAGFLGSVPGCVAVALARRGWFEMAIAAARSIELSGARVECLADIAVELVEHGDRSRARSILAEASAILQGAGRQDSLTVDALAVGQALAGEWELARDTAKSSGEAFTTRKIATLFAEEGRFEEALEAARTIASDRRQYAWALRDIGIIQARGGDAEGARRSFRLALEVEVSGLDDHDASELRGRIATAQISAGLVEEGIAAVQAFKPGHWREHWLTETARVLARGGHGREAVRLVESITVARGERLPLVAAELAARGDRESFLRLLVPAADLVYSARRICGLLAKFYPGHGEGIAALLVLERGRDGGLAPAGSGYTPSTAADTR